MRLLLIVLIAFVISLPAHRSSATPTNCAADPGLSQMETEFISLLNNYRSASGSGPVSNSTALSTAAQWLANDLATHPALFSHTDSTGRDFFTRMVNCGVVGPASENIAGGRFTAADVLAAWKSSPGHNANMLNPAWTRIGIGLSPGGLYGITWVTDFGLAQNEPSLCPYNPGWSLVVLSGSPSGLPPCVTVVYSWEGGVWRHWFRDAPLWVSNIVTFSSGSYQWLLVR